MSLNPTQRAFAVCREPFPAFVGGFGSGKTAAAIARAMGLKAALPDCDIGYYLPTYPLIQDIVARRIPALCDSKGWAYRTVAGGNPMIEFPGAGRIIFRTMERPDRIIGYEVGHSIVDELDTLPIDKAREVWNKIIARNRQKNRLRNTVAVVTTPEGYRFVYERWQKNPAPGYVLFRAKTLDNAHNLPAGYIENLRNSYPPQLLAAYLDGEFVNLTAGAVYTEFDRTLNASTETIQPGDTLHVGMDFNVGEMACVIHVLRGDEPHAVMEFTKVADTPALARMLRDRFRAAGHNLMVYPDASGRARKSVSASESDLTILREHGMHVCVNPTNPLVRDRVLAMNAMFHKDGTRRYKVNVQLCPHYVEALEKQTYDGNGEPNKSSGLDHILDAGGYFIVYRYPIAKRIAVVEPLRI